MKKESAKYFIKTSDGFKCEYDWKELSSYLLPFQDELATIDPQFNQRLSLHYQKCMDNINLTIPKIQDEISSLYDSLQSDPSAQYKLPPVNAANRLIHMELRFLIQKIVKLTKITTEDRLEVLTHQLSLLNALIQLLDFLSIHPKPLMIKINRAVTPVDRTIYTNTKSKAALLHMLRRYANAQLIKISLVPIPFRSANASREFLKEIVDSGVLAKKPGTSYFVELPAEDSLAVFFQSPKSPLCQKRYLGQQEVEPLLPYSGNDDPEYVKNWLFEATSAVSEFLREEYEISEEEEAAISILLERFLFSSTYPLLYPKESYDPDFVRKMEEFAKQTPTQIGILPKYIPENCADRPAHEMFEINSISRAPAEWFRNALVQVCPIDAAYCIVKVHESLSVMAVLRATAAKANSQMEDFCEKMPGFDDIFEIWLSLLCISGAADPQRLMNFIDIYSRLPGFSARVMASIAYLEASLTQLKST